MKAEKQILPITRRQFMTMGTLFGGVLLCPSLLLGKAEKERTICLYNIHTGESLKRVYWANGQYQKNVFKEINHLFRDHRSNVTYPINPALIDLLSRLQEKLGTRQPLHIVSGFRSREANFYLCKHSKGVARNSFHTQGKAADIFIPKFSIRAIYKVARSLRAGGVGAYPASRFVHVDVGPRRYW